MSTPDPHAKNAPLRWVAIATVLLGSLWLSYFQITNLDLGGHLTVGRQILKTGAIPDQDFMSHTATGRPYPVHQWLGEVLLFGTDHVFGVPGLILLRMGIVAIGAVLLYRVSRREGAPVVVASAIVLLLLVAARPRFFMRPFLVSLLFLPLLQMWLARLRRGETRRPWPLLVLFTVWGHLHSGVLFGILMLLGTVAGEGLKRLLFEKRPPLLVDWPGSVMEAWSYRRLVIWSAAAIALPFATMALVNPSGLKPLVLPFLFWKHSGFQAMIGEYRTVDLMIDWPFDLVAGALLLGIVLRFRRVDLTDLIVTVGFGILAFQSVRGILPFAAVSAPILARTWGDLAVRSYERVAGAGGRPRMRVSRANKAETVAILVLVTATVLIGIRVSRDWIYPFGFGKDARHYPERALDFVQAQGFRGPLFNTDIYASALLWRFKATSHRVFVDARLEVYPEEFWKDTYYRVLETAPGWREVLDRYDVHWAIVRRAAGQTDDRLGDALWEDPEWGLVYWDDGVMLFIRRNGGHRRNDRILQDWEFRSFSPRRPQDVRELRDADLVNAANELAEIVEWTPEAFLPSWALGAAWTGIGQGQMAAELFEELATRRDARDNDAFTRSRAEAWLVAGDRRGWEQLLRSTGADPTTVEELFPAAALLGRAGRREEAIVLYREAVEKAPDDLDLQNNLALLLAQELGGRSEAERLIEQVLHRRPDDPYYIATRGEIRWRSGDDVGATEDFQRALLLLPEEDEAARAEIANWLDRID